MKIPSIYFHYRIPVDALIALFAAYWGWKYSGFILSKPHEHIDELLPVSGALFGFVLTANVFILNRFQGESFRILRESKSMPYLRHAMKASLFRTFILFSGLLIFRAFPWSEPAWLMPVMIGWSAATLVSVYALLSVIFSVVDGA